MDFDRLERNICDNILEAQLKLGYDGRPLSLNYTLSSLCHLLGKNMSAEDMQYALFQFALCTEPALGELSFRKTDTGYCITIPSEGTSFVNEYYDKRGFIGEFINKIRSHCSSAEEVIDIFRKYSDSVSVEEIDSDEFQYLVRFTDGIPDEYFYCISAEEEIDGSIHVTYHRFIREDYEELGF